MKIITIEDIRSLKPCYDPSRYIPEDWEGTALDILRMENIPAKDRLWVVLKENVLDTKTLRLFAVWCARQSIALAKNPDPRSIAACNVSERYAHGEASYKELKAAEASARVAAKASNDAVLSVAAVHAAYAAVHAAEFRVCAAWAANDARNATAVGDFTGIDDWSVAAIVASEQVKYLIEMIDELMNKQTIEYLSRPEINVSAIARIVGVTPAYLKNGVKYGKISDAVCVKILEYARKI